MPRIVVDERPPTRLAMRVAGKKRWGPREDVEDVPRGIGFSSKSPGGHADLTSKLGRQIFQEYGDLNPFDDVVVYGPGVSSAWEGRMVAFPRESDTRTIQPSAVGYSAHLRDDPSVREVYCDRRLSAFATPPSIDRQIALGTAHALGAAWTTEIAFDDSSNDPALVQKTSHVETGAGADPFSYTETWYGAEGVSLERLYYELSTVNSPGGSPTLDPGDLWHCVVAFANDDVLGSTDTSGDVNPSAATYYVTSGSDRNYIALQTYFSGGPTSIDSEWQARWRKLAAYGTHGLTRRGTDPGGFYGHDLIVDLLSRWAPLLNFTVGETILPDTSFIVPHFTPGLEEPWTVEDAVLALNAFFLNDFYVWDDRTFWWVPQSYQPRVWNARVKEGATLKLEGPQSDTLINGVMASFTDFAGRQRSIGPPGSRCNQTDASLEDIDPENPVNSHGIPRRWAKLQIAQQTSFEGALNVAQRYLALAQLTNQQGQMTITRDCEDSNGRRWPAWMVRAGDYARVQDGDQTLRKVINANYDHDSLKVTLDLDVPSFRLDALLERMGVLIVGVVG